MRSFCPGLSCLTTLMTNLDSLVIVLIHGAVNRVWGYSVRINTLLHGLPYPRRRCYVCTYWPYEWTGLSSLLPSISTLVPPPPACRNVPLALVFRPFKTRLACIDGVVWNPALWRDRDRRVRFGPPVRTAIVPHLSPCILWLSLFS